MYRNMIFVFGALLACLLCSAVYAQETAAPLDVPAIEAGAANAYGYNADDVAVSQAVVLYWYAHGFANAYGNFPANFAALVEKGLPLRKFISPHTGDEINPDDGTLDFDGDMLYKPGECWDVSVEVQTSKGVVSIPGTVTATSDISVQYDPCCCPELCGGCCYVGCEKCEDWGICDPMEAACKIVQWMMWKSFELHECMYGMRPADEKAWMASGLAPIDANYKEYVPTMDIEYIYSKGNCCVLKKAKVTCCAPCVPCSPCKSVCKPEAPCGSCNKCECKCNTCKPKCETGCKSKCGSCNKCKQSTCNKCDTCKPKCDTGCKSKCDTGCKSKCGSCDKCKQNTCSKCKPNNPCGKCKDKCGSCAKPGCSKCS